MMTSATFKFTPNPFRIGNLRCRVYGAPPMDISHAIGDMCMSTWTGYGASCSHSSIRCQVILVKRGPRSGRIGGVVTFGIRVPDW